MPDHAVSTSPAVQAQLDRLWALSPAADVLGLERISALCAALGHPERSLPPVFHVAGTNGKGSTCAFLRAMLSAAGYRVHAYTSPHLVRFNERIRIAGALITDEALAPLLTEVLDAAEAAGISASFFEITTAAAFLAFARTPADACVIEVGLGGRLDATNVVTPIVCGIASLGIDHEAFLLAPEAGTPEEPLARIAFEKAGIAKSGVPLVTLDYRDPVRAPILEVAARVGAPVFAANREWAIKPMGMAASYADASGQVTLPRPTLTGAHQLLNAGLAVAMLRHQNALAVTDTALAEGISAARWPGRLQRLADGPLTALATGRPIWLDGGHNPDAGQQIARAFRAHEGPLDLIIGMLANKDPAALLAPLAEVLGERLAAVQVVPVPGHDWHDAAAFAAVNAGPAPVPADDLSAAVSTTRHPVLIAGSLYLAGEALRLNDEIPD